MKRREFLKQTAAGATVLAAGPGATGASAAGPSATARPVIGQGEHRYECLHDWAKLPEGFRWQTTQGVAIDGAGFIYVKHSGAGEEPVDTIVVFDPDGRFVRSFGKEYHRGGHGIDVRKEGRDEFLYLCDTFNRQVVKTTLKGEQVWKISYPQEAGVYQELSQFRPTNVAFAPDGGFYVADGYGSHYIHQYDRNAKWVRTWGGKGTEPGKFQTPHGIWLDDRPGRAPSVVVADRANTRLQYFTLDGRHTGTVDGFLFPAHFDIRGDVLLVPDLHARVTLLDRENKPIVHLGDDPSWTAEVKASPIRKDPTRWPAGKFVHPHDACFDPAGNIFVAEWVDPGRITKLRHVG